MKRISDLNEGQLFRLANLATGGYFDGPWSSNKKEVEVGGYGKRRRVQWVQNTEGYDEEHYFEISEENNDGWAWHCSARQGKYKSNFEGWQLVNSIAPHRIVDFLRKHNFNIENYE